MSPLSNMRPGFIEIAGGLGLSCFMDDVQFPIDTDKELIVNVKADYREDMLAVLQMETLRSRGVVLIPEYSDKDVKMYANIETVHMVHFTNFFGTHIAMSCHVTSIDYKERKWMRTRKLWKRTQFLWESITLQLFNR